jgi:hypothetical protein
VLEQDSSDRRARTGQLIQNSRYRTAKEERTGQYGRDKKESEEDGQNMSAGRGHLGQVNRGRTATTEQSVSDIWGRTARTGPSGQVGLTGHLDRTEETKGPEHEHKDRKARYCLLICISQEF